MRVLLSAIRIMYLFLRWVEHASSRKAYKVMTGIITVIKALFPKIANVIVTALMLIADHAKQYADALDKKYHFSCEPEEKPEDVEESSDNDMHDDEQKDDHDAEIVESVAMESTSNEEHLG